MRHEGSISSNRGRCSALYAPCDRNGRDTVRSDSHVETDPAEDEGPRPLPPSGRLSDPERLSIRSRTPSVSEGNATGSTP